MSKEKATSIPKQTQSPSRSVDTTAGLIRKVKAPKLRMPKSWGTLEPLSKLRIRDSTLRRWDWSCTLEFETDWKIELLTRVCCTVLAGSTGLWVEFAFQDRSAAVGYS
ncbi:hypothetical protein BO78DRAFT_397481 [Aspergillus sclerotiicarbonarius CBS 121057]|uniref:Uncharacterized protein n=1 Tax=Aspergillus sclerotiicarbonarius (strain CBS 121057 / IBT 28362) TaxID=1448318 RepID=A0A319E7F9_ASPSB|nr:hypothetical protein BO78DRAFT_397481 [Aspergillus sclerotiicarbonarius CBS 121057]